MTGVEYVLNIFEYELHMLESELHMFHVLLGLVCDLFLLSVNNMTPERGPQTVVCLHMLLKTLQEAFVFIAFEYVAWDTKQNFGV